MLILNISVQCSLKKVFHFFPTKISVPLVTLQHFKTILWLGSSTGSNVREILLLGCELQSLMSSLYCMPTINPNHLVVTPKNEVVCSCTLHEHTTSFKQRSEHNLSSS